MLRFAAMVAMLGVAGCNRPAQAPAERASSGAAGPQPVRIPHFYAGARQIAAGGRAGLRDGVENARPVRLEPPLESLQPGFNRCFYVTPPRRATYRLAAGGVDGSPAGATVTVSVAAAAPPPPANAASGHGQFTLVFASAPEVCAGGAETLCHGTPEAVSVEVDPPAARQGFQDRPERTTRYTFAAVGPTRLLEPASVTVKVRDPE